MLKLRNMTCVYLLRGNQILLLYRVGSKVVPPSWCGIGGHFEETELNNPESCVLRELHEETGISPEDINGLRLRYITLRRQKDEIRQNYYYFAYVNHGDIPPGECSEGILEWADINGVLERDMPLSAKRCLTHYFALGRYTEHVYAGVTGEDGTAWREILDF